MPTRPEKKRPRPLTRTERLSRYLRRTFHLPTLQPDGDFLARVGVCAALTILLALLQTTIFARFRPFGAIPDLMLPLVVAIGMTEGEQWGAVWGLIAAYMIESLGAGGISLLPLLYMPAGYFCPVLTELYLTDTPPVRLIYTAVCGIGRAVITLLYFAITSSVFDLPALLGDVTLPEYASTFVMSLPVHLIVYLSLHPFHKSRSERVGTL